MSDFTTWLFCFSRPNGLIYQKFRNQFLAFSIFQSECLLNSALGEGLVSWGLSPTASPVDISAGLLESEAGEAEAPDQKPRKESFSP
jgi:hypothetical protein